MAAMNDASYYTQDTTSTPNPVALFRLLHSASQSIAATRDAAGAGQALMQFAAATRIDVARLFLFSDFADGQPTTIEMRESWSSDKRPAQPYGTRLPLSEFPLLDLASSDSTVVCENADLEEGLASLSQRLVDELDVHSFAIIPLTARRQMITDRLTSAETRPAKEWLGVLIIGRDKPSTYDENLLLAYWTLASQTASVIQGFRLRHETRQRLKELTVLLETSAAVSASLDAEKVLHTTAAKITDALGADGCAISSWNRENDTLVTLLDFSFGRAGWDPEPPGTVYRLEEYPASRQVLISRRPTVIHASDPNADPAELEWMSEDGIQSVLMVPMVVRDESVGSLELQYAREDKVFSTTEIALCQALANQAAAAVVNARLFAQTQHRTTQLQTGADVSRAASSILEPDQLMQRVVDLVRERFELYYVGLFLVDDTGEWALLRAGTGEAGRVQIENGHILTVGDESMVGWCIANAEARISQDVGMESTRYINPLLPETRSEMALPLINRGKVIGAMTIQSIHESAFSKEDISALQTMADQLSVAIANARLFAERSRRSDELATLNLIAATVSRSLDMQDLLEAVLEAVVSITGFDAGLISLHDERTGKLHLASHQNLPESMVKMFEQRGLGGTLCDVVFKTGETLGLGDVRDDAPIDTSGLVRNGLLAYVGIPVVQQESILGTLCVFSATVRDLDDSVLSLLEAIGHQIGVGVQNARLFDQVQDALDESESQARRLSMLNEMSRELSQTVDLGEILEIAAFRTAQILSSDRVTVNLVDSDQESFTVLALHGEKGDSAVGDRRPLAGSSIETAVRENRLVRGSSGPADDLGGMRSFIIAPLLAGERSIGTINVGNRKPDIYSPRDENLLLQVASLLSAAMENRRLIEQTRRTADELSMLFGVSQELAGTLLRPEEIAETVVRRLLGLGEVECSFAMMADDKDTMTVVADFVLEPDGAIRREETQETFRLSEYPATARVMQTLQPVVIQAGDSQADEAELAYMREQSISTLAIVPLSTKGMAIGVMELEAPNGVHYASEQLGLITTLANQAAAALENARLIEEMETRALREQQLRQVIASINLSEDLLANIPAVTEHLRQVVPVDVISLTSYISGDTEYILLAGGTDPNYDHGTWQGTRFPLKGNTPGWVITHGLPRLDADLRDDPALLSNDRLPSDRTRSRAILPLKIGDRVIGTLNLSSQRPAAFPENKLTILTQVADQFALALERARLLEETRQALVELQAIQRRYLREQWDGMLGAESDRVWGYVDDPQGLKHAENEWTPEIEHAVCTGEPSTVLESGNGHQVQRSGLAVPIQLLGQTIGVLDFFDEERVWTDDDKALIETLADQVALAVENQRLFEQTQRRAHREHLTGEIVGRIRAAGDVQNILKTAAEELGRALGVSNARVHLGGPADESRARPIPDKEETP
jgi:GAF domain-containing protein